MIDVRAEFQGAKVTTRRSSTAYIVVHHAAALYPTPTALDDIRAVARYHAQKWPDFGAIGYHAVVAETTNGGAVEAYQCSDLDLQRAHVALMNDVAVGVSCLTNFGSSIPHPKWIEGLASVLRPLTSRYPRAQIVGHKEIARPGYETACPGSRWQEWKPRLLALVAQPRPVPLTGAASADTPIIAPSSCTPEQVARYIVGKGPLYDIYDVHTILASYWHWCEEAGVNPHVVVAQMCHETNVLRSWWCDRPRRNGCGNGVTGHFSGVRRVNAAVVEHVTYPLWAFRDSSNRYEEGISFPTWDHAARAHVGRLAAYAVPLTPGTLGQRAIIAYALALRDLPAITRGAAPTIGGLGGKERWAPSPEYWRGIARHMDAISAIVV